MLRRTTCLALLALALPALAHAQSREWEEDYGDEQRADAPSPGDYDVSVEVSDGASAPVETFYEPLASYGEWVTVSGYGRVWRPRVAAGWRPYYYGRWEWTNEGWLWVSDEPWGWAAYHYGRWTYDPSYGWLWLPGSQWAPAWVAWRYSGDVVGWAPLGPGVSVYVTAYPFVDTWWTFVPTTRFCSYPVYDVAYAPGYTRRFYHETQPAPPRPRPAYGRPVSTPAWGGPAPRVIEQHSGRPVSPVRIVPAPRPGAATRPAPGEVSVFRPGARSGRDGGAPREAPVPRGVPVERPGGAMPRREDLPRREDFPRRDESPRRDDGPRTTPPPGRASPAPGHDRGGDRPGPRVREERGAAPAPSYRPSAEPRSAPPARPEPVMRPAPAAPAPSAPPPSRGGGGGGAGGGHVHGGTRDRR